MSHTMLLLSKLQCYVRVPTFTKLHCSDACFTKVLILEHFYGAE